MSGFHYWYKGAWKCKSSSLANPNVAAATAPAATPASPAAPTPAPQVVTSPVPTAPTVQTKPALVGTARERHQAEVDANATKFFLNTKYIRNYTIQEDGTVDVDGDVEIDGCGIGMPHLPVNFGMVKGNFTTKDVAFTSFKGFPKHVGGNMVIKQRIIVPDYTGFPSFVGGMALIKPIQAKSLKGFPKYIAKRAEITISGDSHSLSEVGEFGGSLYLNVEDAPLPSLDGLQSTIHGSFEVMAKGLSSLTDFPTEVNGFVTLVLDMSNNPTKQMHKHIKKINGVLALMIASAFDQKDKDALPPLLSVCLIKGVTEFTFSPTAYSKSLQTPMQRDFENQINNAIATNQDIHELQEQLIDSGFAKAARI